MEMPSSSPLQPQDAPNQGEAQPTAEQQPQESPLIFNPIQVKNADGMGLEDTLKKLSDEVMVSFRKRQTWRRPFETLWGNIYRLYVGQTDNTRLSTRAKVVMPKVFQAIEAGVPKLISILFGKTPWFEAKSTWSTRPINADTLRAIEALLGHQLKLSNFFKKFVEYAKQLLLYGTSYITVTWKVKRAWVTERVAVRQPQTILGTEMPGYGLKWENNKPTLKVVERRPEITVLPIESVFPASDQTDVQDGEGIMWLDSISMMDLEELSAGRVPVYSNFQRVKELGSIKGSDPLNNMVQVKASARGVQEPKSETARDHDDVQLLHFWGKKDLDGDGFKEEVHIVIANNSVVVRAVSNPYEHQKRPLIKGNLFPVPNEWFGMGFVEPAMPALSELNTLHNQYLDMNNLIINRMWKVDPTMDVDLDTLRSVPNGIVLATPLNAVEALDGANIPFSPVQMINILETEVESTMVPKSVQGTPESGALGRTARGAQLIVNQALEKYGAAATLQEQTVLDEMLMQMHQLNGQFLDQDKYLKDIYSVIFPVVPTPEQIRCSVGFTFLGVSETVTKEASVNQMTAYVNTWGAVLQQRGMDLMPLAREHWKMLDMKMTAEEALPEPATPQIPGVGGIQSGGSDALQAQTEINGAAPSGNQLPPLQPLQGA